MSGTVLIVDDERTLARAVRAFLVDDGHDVTLLDMQPPGEYTSFGNAGILSPGSCVPLATPGIAWNVPGYLADPMGPLAVRWGYMPRALPWFMRFLAAARPEREFALGQKFNRADLERRLEPLAGGDALGNLDVDDV